MPSCVTVRGGAIILCIEEKTPVPPQRHGGLTTIEEGLP